VDRRDWSTPHFLFIGKDWEGKNGEAVVRAFDRLRRDTPEATLDIVGNHPPLDSAGVTGHGPLSLDDPASRRRIEALYRRATCFVLPSHYEASALVYVEAGAAGLPCIGTINGGTRDLVGDAGRLVDPLDDEGLYQAMRELSNPATAEALGAIARERAPLFSWRAVAERIVRALQLPGVRLEAYAEFL
jgi:glycosyltransferase involved in cell wall biosynthesis